MKKKKKASEKAVIWDILLLFVLPILLAVGVISGRYLARNTDTQRALTGFYQALYVQADLTAASEYLVEEKREDFVSALTMGEANPEFYLDYHEKAAELYGDDVDVKVSVTSVWGASGADDYSGSSDYCKVYYTITMCGSLGSGQYDNSMELVKRGGTWYMTTYLPLPVGYNLKLGCEVG